MTKFEFQKLELPQQVSKPITNPEYDTQRNNKKVGNNLLYMAFGVVLGYFGHFLLVNIPKFPKPLPISDTLLPKLSPDSTIRKPVHFNYYDSIVFLNQVKGSKVVISEGYDDYVKRNKLIVKTGGYYYSLYCNDLISTYSVGDSIP